MLALASCLRQALPKHTESLSMAMLACCNSMNFLHCVTKASKTETLDLCQGHIFPKIQPTTICRIEHTLDKNQAKTQ